MNYWKISTFVLALAVVGLLSLSASGGSLLQGSFSSSSSAVGSGHSSLMTEIESVHDELGYSTWTLETIGLGVYQSSGSVIDEVREVQERLGTSTWTLAALASQIATNCN